MVVSIASIYGQSRIKKYNNVMKRYEYYDSSGRMIGYDTYNSVMKQWEHYSTNTPSAPTKQVSPYIAPYDVELIERAARYNQQRLDAQRARNQQVYDYNLGLINQAVARFNNSINQLPEDIFNSYSSNAKSMANELNILMDRTNILDGNSVKVLLNRVDSYIKTVSNWGFLASLGTGTTTDRRQSTTNKPDSYIGKQIYLYDGTQLYDAPLENGKIDKYTGGLVHVVEKVSDTLYYKILYNNRYYYVSSTYMKPLVVNNTSAPDRKHLDEHRKIIGE